MKRTSIRRALVPGVAVLALAAGLGCCGRQRDAPPSETDSGSQRHPQRRGCPAQEAAQTAWRAGFQGDNAGVTVNYDPSAPAPAARSSSAAAYAFAGSDSYLKPTRRTRSPSAEERCGGDPIEVPAYVSPIAVDLQRRGRRRAPAVRPRPSARSSTSKITTWNDPAIAEDNPDADLPSRGHHAGAPLRRVGHDRATSPTTSRRPCGRRLAARRGRGVADQGRRGAPRAPRASCPRSQSGDGTIGYADESQAGDLSVANIEVGRGVRRPDRRGRRPGPRGLPAGRGPLRRSTWPSTSTATPTEAGRLPARAHVVPHRLPASYDDAERRPTWSRAT